MKKKKLKEKREEKEKTKKEKAKKVKLKAFKAVLAGEKVYSNASQAAQLYEQSRFGELQEGKVYYSLVESLYLLEKGKMQIYSEKKKLTLGEFLEIARKKEEIFYKRYVVYRNMRDRGYILKTALKFGADFRVYDRGIKPGEEHAKWILYAVYETSGLTWHEFAAKNRVAHSTRKNLLIGIVDEENDVTFYEIRWIRP